MADKNWEEILEKYEKSYLQFIYWVNMFFSLLSDSNDLYKFFSEWKKIASESLYSVYVKFWI